MTKAPALKTPSVRKENRIFLYALGDVTLWRPYIIREAINKNVADIIREVQKVLSSFALVLKGLREA